jgi:hypothetical protein
VLQFLTQRAGKALQRALGDPLVAALGGLRSGADDDHPAGVADVAQQRREELVQRRQLGRIGDAGGVEHQPAERIRPAAAEVCAHHVVVGAQGRAQRFDNPAFTADQQRSRQRWLTCPIAPQLLGLRYAKLLGEERAGPGVDDLGE